MQTHKNIFGIFAAPRSVKANSLATMATSAIGIGRWLNIKNVEFLLLIPPPPPPPKMARTAK